MRVAGIQAVLRRQAPRFAPRPRPIVGPSNCGNECTPSRTRTALLPRSIRIDGSRCTARAAGRLRPRRYASPSNSRGSSKIIKASPLGKLCRLVGTVVALRGFVTPRISSVLSTANPPPLGCAVVQLFALAWQVEPRGFAPPHWHPTLIVLGLHVTYRLVAPSTFDEALIIQTFPTGLRSLCLAVPCARHAGPLQSGARASDMVGTAAMPAGASTAPRFRAVRSSWATHSVWKSRRSRSEQRHARAGVPTHFPTFATSVQGALGVIINDGVTSWASNLNRMLNRITLIGPVGWTATTVWESLPSGPLLD